MEIPVFSANCAIPPTSRVKKRSSNSEFGFILMPKMEDLEVAL